MRGCNGGWDCRKSARAEVTGEDILVGRAPLISEEPAGLSKVFLINFDKNSKRVWHGRAGEVAGTRGEVLRLMALGHCGWVSTPHTLPKMKISLNTLGGTGRAMACLSAPAKAPRATT
jgi:hypothetical protein